MAPHFHKFKSDDARKALQCLDMDENGKVDWNEFKVSFFVCFANDVLNQKNSLSKRACQSVCWSVYYCWVWKMMKRWILLCALCSTSLVAILRYPSIISKGPTQDVYKKQHSILYLFFPRHISNPNSQSVKQIFSNF